MSSSFFTVPASQRKRKRPDGPSSARPFKRRDVDRSDDRNTERKLPTQRARKRVQEREKEEQRDSKHRASRKDEDEDISGSESDDGAVAGGVGGAETPSDSYASSEEDENAADRRIRLAQRYLDNIKADVTKDAEVGFDAKDLDDENIARRLKDDADEARGRQFRRISNTLDWSKVKSCRFRADTLATTGVAGCLPFVYTVSKDKSLIKWKLEVPKFEKDGFTNGIEGQSEKAKSRKPGPGKKRPQQMAFVKGVKVKASTDKQHGHTAPILCVAASPDGRFVATGGADRKLIIWSAEDLRPLKTFTTHRDTVLDLAFAPLSTSQPGLGQQLFSASADRSLKTYSLAGEESLAYVETLFGHQDHVQAVSAMAVDLCVSVGARDRSARVWKVVEEQQMKFLGDSSAKDKYQTGRLDCVAAITAKDFVTGSDSGAINLWSITRKKTMFTVYAAHGVEEPPPLEDVTSESGPKVIEELKKVDTRKEQARAITALAALPGTDVFLSGSWDGWVRVWKLSDDKRNIVSLGVLGDETFSGEGKLTNGLSNGLSNGLANGHVTSQVDVPEEGSSLPSSQTGPLKGVINSMAIFERRKKIEGPFGEKREGESQGLCVVIGTGKESRLGRHRKFQGGKNGAVVFEIPVM